MTKQLYGTSSQTHVDESKKLNWSLSTIKNSCWLVLDYKLITLRSQQKLDNDKKKNCLDITILRTSLPCKVYEEWIWLQQKKKLKLGSEDCRTFHFIKLQRNYINNPRDPMFVYDYTYKKEVAKSPLCKFGISPVL